MVDALFKQIWIFRQKKEGKSSNEFFLPAMVNDDFILLLCVIVIYHAHLLPYIFLAFINRRQGMWLIRPLSAPSQPIFNRLIFFPSIVTGELLSS